MIDRLKTKNLKTHELVQSGYIPEHAILRKNLIENSNSDTLNVLLAPWHGGGYAYSRHVARSSKYANTLQYIFHDGILSPDPSQVLESFLYIQMIIAADLQSIAKQYARIHLISASLSTPIAAMISDAFDGFDEITLVVPGDNLAYCCWHGRRTQHLRTQFEHAGVSYQQLEHLWRPMEPTRYVRTLSKKNINILISLNDEIIPTPSQLRYLEAVKGINHKSKQIKYSRYGHYVTVGKYYLFGGI